MPSGRGIAAEEYRVRVFVTRWRFARDRNPRGWDHVGDLHHSNVHVAQGRQVWPAPPPSDRGLTEMPYAHEINVHAASQQAGAQFEPHGWLPRMRIGQYTCLVVEYKVVRQHRWPYWSRGSLRDRTRTNGVELRSAAIARRVTAHWKRTVIADCRGQLFPIDGYRHVHQGRE